MTLLAVKITYYDFVLLSSSSMSLKMCFEAKFHSHHESERGCEKMKFNVGCVKQSLLSIMLSNKVVALLCLSLASAWGLQLASTKSIRRGNLACTSHASRLSSLRMASTVDTTVLKDEKTQVPAEGTMFKSPVFKMLDFLFTIPIIHDLMFGIYRKQIVEKSEKMGLPWTDFMDDQWGSLPTLQARAESLTDPSVTIPSYYYAPIHAYKEGNLCWESAMEEDLWSKLMIAPLYNNALGKYVTLYLISLSLCHVLAVYHMKTKVS